jgi:hypothetical protein
MSFSSRAASFAAALLLTSCTVVQSAGDSVRPRDADRPVCTAYGDFNRDGVKESIALGVVSWTESVTGCLPVSTSLNAPSDALGEAFLGYWDADEDGDGDVDRGSFEFCVPASVRPYIRTVRCQSGNELTAHALRGSDCDDTNARRGSHLPEVCDRADNDCDGLIDEGC